MPVHEVQELREQRASLFEEMKKINDSAEAEKRDLTSEEAQNYDRIESDFESLERRIARQEKLEGVKPKRLNNPATTDLVETDDEEQRAAVKSLNEYRTRLENERRGGPLPQDEPEYRAAFFAYLVKGRESLEPEEVRTLSKATAAAGANLVPTDFERTLVQLLRQFGVMRQLATVLTTDGGHLLQVPSVAAHGASAWVAENAAFTPADETFGQLSLSAYKNATIIQVSEELLADSAFDLEAYISNEFGQRTGVIENTAYVVGDGSGKPTGLVPNVTIGKTGATGQTLTITGDDIIDLFHSVPVAYRRNAVFVGNDAIVKALRKVKDNYGQYLWQPGLQAGEPDVLFGRELHVDPDVPTPAANAVSLVFGDFSYYWIRDVRGVAFQRLNELYAANGQVGFRTYHRTDGKIVQPAALRGYQHSAT